MTNAISRKSGEIVGFFSLLMLGACGLQVYPGQPGMATHEYSKIDLEYLEPEGLYVYEAKYDNRQGANGVAVLATKLYPGAQTYTSNVRLNGDGTLYRGKKQYNGALLQIISIPKLNELYISPDSQVLFLLSYDISFDETDDQNVAETDLFSNPTRLLDVPFSNLRRRLEWLRAGTLTRAGTLSYIVKSVDFGAQKLTFATPVNVQTSLLGNGLQSDLTASSKQSIAQFVESHFPTGYKGPVVLTLEDGKTLSFNIGINTVNTLKRTSTRVTVLSQKELQRIYQGE